MKTILKKKTKNFSLILCESKKKYIVKLIKNDNEIYDRAEFSDIEFALSYFKETLKAEK